jgi:Arc/MetJ family transcription regulator
VPFPKSSIIEEQEDRSPLDKCINYAYLYIYNCILLRGFMRTTLNIEDSLLARAAELTGVKEKTALVRLGLEALIARESAKRLAALGGVEKDLEMIPRRRLEEN